MTTQSKLREKEIEQQLGLLVSCLNTIKVLTVLAERVASPKEIGDAVELSTPTASHHVKKLLRLNLVELIEERIVGGTVQHFYRAITRPLVNSEEWEMLGLDDRQKYSLWIMQLILTDAAKSFAAQLFDVHPQNHLSRTPMVVDEEGLTEVAGIQDRALKETIDSQARIAERMARTGEAGMNIIAAMMCFPIPEPKGGHYSVWDLEDDA